MKKTTIMFEKFGRPDPVTAYLVPGPWPGQTIAAYRQTSGDWVAVDHASRFRLAVRVTRADAIEAARVELLKMGKRWSKLLFKIQSPPPTG